MFIPLKDLNPSRTYPFVNITLILANIVVFIYEIGLEATLPRRAFDALLLPYSTVPARFPAFLAGHTSFEVSFVPLVTSMFLHSGFLHLAGNMLFLWIFGDNVEDFFGHIPYLFFYMVCGVGHGCLHLALSACADSYAGFYIPFACACRDLSGLVVRHAISRRDQHDWGQSHRRSGRVGAHRRILAGNAADDDGQTPLEKCMRA